MTQPARRTLLRRTLRFCVRGLLAIFATVASYLLAAVILGLLPVNASWQQPATGTAIYAWSNGVHTDLVLPVRSSVRDWTRLVPLLNGEHYDASWIQLGWGDRGFYLETPRWADLKLTTTVHAVLLPSSTVMHVVYLANAPNEDDRSVRVLLSDAQFDKLLRYIDASFRPDAGGKWQRIPVAGYTRFDEFWEGAGSYHLFRTCNDWTNNALAEIGVRAALWSPFDHAIFYQLR